MSRIVIGKAGGKNIGLDLDVLLRTHLLIWASTGGGKSWLIRRLAEQVFGKVPVIIIDKEGEFSTLREKFGFVLVGQGGETPADVRSAKLLAEKLLELRASAVCDLQELKHETRHEWVKTFVNGLVDAPKRLWGPRVVVIDEAHVFCPEKGQGESPAYGAVADLAGVGRKRGIGVVLATQRLSKLSKNATGEMYNQAAGPTARQADRDRAAYEMGISNRPEIKEFSETLRTLERGHFFFQGRAISMDRILVAVAPVETTHPDVGSKNYKAQPPPPPERVKALLPKLKDLPQAAEEKAKTEAEFRSEIRSLKAQLRAAVATSTNTAKLIPQKVVEKVIDTRAIERAVGPAMKQIAGFRALLEEAMKMIVKVNAIGFEGTTLKPEEITEVLAATAREVAKLAKQKLTARAGQFETLKRDTNRLLAKMKNILSQEDIAVDVKVTHTKPFSIASQAPRALPRPLASQAPPPDGITRRQADILRALAEFEAIGRNEIPRTWVAARAGASHRSSAYGNNLGALRSAGLIEYGANSSVRLSASGRDAVPQIPAPLSTEEMLESCLKIIGVKQGAILKALHEVYPESLSREEVADRAGSSPLSSAYTNNLGALRSAGMIEYGPGSMVKCADWLFID